MNAETAAALRRRIESDPDTDRATLATATDTALAIGGDVWRLRWRNQITTAVAEDANLHTTCGALLDALAILEATKAGQDLALDRSIVNVLIDRPLPDGDLSETDQAVRSLRDAASGVQARVWYRRGDAGWVDDVGAAPIWHEEDPIVRGWVDDYLMPRLTTPPGGLAVQIVAAVDDPSLQLYPSAIKHRSTETWALRIDGLQIGTASATTATLTIGKPGKNGDGPQRTRFTEVFGRPAVTVTVDGSVAGELTVNAAADGIQRLLRAFREADVRGAPLSHRAAAGVRFIDEHTLEARLLKGLAHLTASEHQLVLDDSEAARGSQFPTLWGHRAKPRYLDALLRRSSTPLAVELKVATGGQGRYYRRSLIQAALYAHFIRHATGLDPWFRAAGLDRTATQPCIGVPIPSRWTKRFGDDLELLERVAGNIGVEVHILDDRATPDWTVPGRPFREPDESAYEQLSWRLASALSTLWPASLGRVVETHDAGGLYDQIQLQPLSDRSLDWPAPRPRVSLNRPGSVWVFAQTGQPRWVWREIWSHLANGGDADQAAITIGAIAGLGPPERSTRPTFADVAAAFAELTNDAGFSWRCAWPGENYVSTWVDRFSNVLARYGRMAKPGSVPTIGRIWGAIQDGEAAVIVDQENLRCWVWQEGACVEVHEPNPLARIGHAVRLISGSADRA